MRQRRHYRTDEAATARPTTLCRLVSAAGTSGSDGTTYNSVPVPAALTKPLLQALQQLQAAQEAVEAATAAKVLLKTALHQAHEVC